jgi:predicted metal-dependent phosphoesterase TrpH
MLNIDFHTHTYYSKDSLIAPRTLLRVAQKKGLDGVAVTDHDTIKGVKTFAKLKRKKNVPVIIPGIEITVQEGEIVLLFEVDLPPIKRDPHPSVTEVLEIAREMDAVILLPHPFDRFRKGINPATVWKQFDVLETFNARVLLQKYNIQAQKLAIKHKIPQSAGSDAHTPNEIGRARTTLFANGTDLEEIRTCLIRGKTKIEGRRGNPIYPILGWAWKNTRPWLD